MRTKSSALSWILMNFVEDLRNREVSARAQYAVGTQCAVGTQYAVGVSANRSTHTMDLANMGGGNPYL